MILRGWKGAACEHAICDPECVPGHLGKPPFWIFRQGKALVSCPIRVNASTAGEVQALSVYSENSSASLFFIKFLVEFFKGTSCELPLSEPVCVNGDVAALELHLCKHRFESGSWSSERFIGK